MTTVLTLTGGSESIDFVGGNEFRLLPDGLSLLPPEPVRVMGGDPLLSEGRTLQARRYGNREISIRFKALAATHDTMAASFQKLQRILNYAVKAQASRGTLAGATLAVKLNNQSTQVIFDILDGSLTLAGPLNEILRRGGPLLANELVLIAKPYARGPTVRLENFLVNPGFDVNPGETGRDGGYYLTFAGGEGSGQRLQYTGLTGLVPEGPARFLAGIWVQPTATSGGEQVVMRAGDAWEITWTPDDGRFRVRMTDQAGGQALASSSQTFSPGAWYHVQALALQVEGGQAQQLLFLVVNRKLAGVMRHTIGNLATTGNFTIGAQDNDTRNFKGLVCGAYVLLKNIWPWQLAFLYEYGMRSLVRGTAPDATPPGSDYWGLTDSQYGGVWVFDQSSGNIADSGPGGRTLTVMGSPSYTLNVRAPRGWTSTTGNPNAYFGLASSPRKYGPFSLYFHKTSGISFPIFNQTVTIPAYKKGASANRDWELSFWAQPQTDGVRNTFGIIIQDDLSAVLVNTTVTLGTGLRQYGVKFTHNADSSTFTVVLKYAGTTTASDVYIMNMMLLPGSPFGLSATLGEIANPIPWISSRSLISGPATTGQDNNLKVYGLPGDEPLATRVYVENPV